MDQTVSELEAVRNTDAASSLLPNASAGTIARSANEACSAVPSQHVPGPGLSTFADQTPLPPETTPAASPSSVMPSPQGVSLNTPSLHLELTAHRKAPPVFVQGLSTSAPFQAVTECGARLSPVITPRQPLPVLDLPPFSSTSAVSTSSKKQASVRGVPSLSVHGRSSADHAANHDAASLSGSEAGESDEGDELEMGNVPDAHQSDESDEEAPCAGPSTIIHRSPAFETHSNANSTWSSGAGPSNSPSASRCVTVVPTNLDSKSFSKSVQFASPSPSTLSPKPPRVEASGMSNVQDNAARRAAAAGPSCKTDSLSELRPSLYRIASRSMIDFGTNNWGDRDRVSDTPSISGQTAETTDGYDADVLTRRFRRCSIPNYHHPTSDPPPYPSFSPRPKAPREGVPALVSPVGDETRERLPAYSNSLYLMAVMPRKMEFVAPGVQAKDRKWRRVLCELEGTVFRVYKCPPGASGAGILGDWWERQVGVGDVVGVVSNNAQSQAPAERSTRGEPQEVKVALQRPQTPPPASGDSATREGSGSNGLNTGPSSRAARRASGASFLSSFRSAGNTTRSGRSEQSISNRPESRVPTMELLPVDLHGGRSRSSLESINHNSESPPAHTAVAMPPPRSASRLSFLPSGKPHHRQPNPSKCDLIRAYTLQNAESGLGNDYTKRRNVIRVRVEGEQFLLQAPDVPSVVEWIEVGGHIRCAEMT